MSAVRQGMAGAAGDATLALRDVLAVHVPAGPAVGAFLASAATPATDAWPAAPEGAWDWSHASPAVRTVGAGSSRRLVAGDVVVVGLFDLVVGRPEDALADPAAEPWRDWRGRFAFVRHDAVRDEWWAVSDHFGTLALYWREGSSPWFSSHLQPLLDAPGALRRVDPAALFHYLNFACVPAPLSIVPDVRRLPPGSRVRLSRGRVDLARWWRPAYPEDLHDDEDGLSRQLREHMVAAIQRQRPDGDAWGCFLSGGTDSSSITTVLARQRRGEAVHSYSIGFAEPGYDELAFARIAADACGAQGHFGSIDEAETLAVLPQLPRLFDQPFGNASAVPTLACAAMAARDGRAILLAGDGGDEIFGGNERYAKDQWMQRWYRLPDPVKRLGRAFGRRVGGGRHRFLNRVDNFTRRAGLPNPDRFYTDDAFASECFDALLAPRLRADLAPDLSLHFLRELYAGSDARTEVHRLMALDLELAIAGNDLVKVDGAARHAGVSVRFPFLDPDLVAFTGRLPARLKVDGTRKRVLFRRATQGILPAAILAKPKQGFGLPISVWMRERPMFRDWLRDLLLSQRSRERGWFEPGYVAGLFDHHQAGGWDHSAHLWSLAVLELWVRDRLEGGAT